MARHCLSLLSPNKRPVDKRSVGRMGTEELLKKSNMACWKGCYRTAIRKIAVYNILLNVSCPLC